MKESQCHCHSYVHEVTSLQEQSKPQIVINNIIKGKS